MRGIAAGVALFLFGMLCMEQGFKAYSGGALQRFLFLGIHYMEEGFSDFSGQIDLTQYAMSGIAVLLVFTLLGVVLMLPLVNALVNW